MNILIKWLGGRKFIIAQQMLLIGAITAIIEKMTPALATILVTVGAGYGIMNVANKYLGGNK